MRRLVLLPLALTGLTLTPCHGFAQLREPERPPRVALTPLLALRVGYTATGSLAQTSDGETTFGALELQVDGAPGVGGSFEASALGPLTVSGALIYTTRGDSRGTFTSEGQETEIAGREGTLLFATLGLGVRLRDEEAGLRIRHPTASLVIAPALIREDPPEDPDSPPEVTEPLTHWAVSIGLLAESTLWSPRFGFHLALSDFVTFWNNTELSRRMTRELQDETLDPDARVDVDLDPSHVLQARVGLSLRF